MLKIFLVAVLVLSAVLRADANQAEFTRGLAFFRQYNPDSAVFYLGKTVAAPAPADSILLFYAEALLWKKEFNAAGTVLERVVRKTEAPFRRIRAMHLEMTQRLPEALAQYDTLMQADKPLAIDCFRKAQLLSWLERFDEAVQLFSRAAADANASEETRFSALARRAEVMAWQGHIEEGVQALDIILPGQMKRTLPAGLKGRVLEALQLKGQMLEWLGKFKEAKEAYKNILVMESDNKRAKLSLEKLLWVK